MNRTGLMVMSLLACSCLLGGCGRLEKKGMVGTYELVYRLGPNRSLGVETLVLKADGTFDQTFNSKHGKGWKNSGRWHLQKGGMLSVNVFLSDRKDPIDSQDRVINPPSNASGAYPTWKSGSTIKIEVEPDIPWRYIKIK